MNYEVYLFIPNIPVSAVYTIYGIPANIHVQCTYLNYVFINYTFENTCR